MNLGNSRIEAMYNQLSDEDRAVVCWKIEQLFNRAAKEVKEK